MLRISVRDALCYMIEDGAIVLFTVIVGGWVLLTIDTFALVGCGSRLMFAFGIVALLAGALAVLAGVIDLVCKLLVDGRRVMSE